jgi:hypothetical protein
MLAATLEGRIVIYHCPWATLVTGGQEIVVRFVHVYETTPNFIALEIQFRYQHSIAVSHLSINNKTCFN